MAEENVHGKPEELTENFTYLDNVKNAMIEEIGGFFEEDLKYMREFMHAVCGNLIRDIMLGNFQLLNNVPPLTLLIKDPDEVSVPTPIISYRNEVQQMMLISVEEYNQKPCTINKVYSSIATPISRAL